MRDRATLFVAVLLAGFVSGAAAADELVRYAIVGDAIPRPLTASPGDPERGRRVAAGIELGNCLACHVLRIYKTDFGRSRHPGRD
jgi:sulfur-oxidizing protein SoxX